MARHEFSNNPDLPLNQAIAKIIEASCYGATGYHDIMTELCRQIYAMGFDDGQSYVWKMRQMQFIDDIENPGKQTEIR